MQDLTNEILELIRLTSTDLPPDVESVLKKAVEQEQPGSAARGALETIMSNIELSRRNSTPICQDTGTPIFYVYYPAGWSTRQLRAQIEAAIAEATRRSFLRRMQSTRSAERTAVTTWAAVISPACISKRSRAIS